MAEILKSILKFKFAKVFDGRMPPHWLLIIRQPKPPHDLIQYFDNPLTMREEIRVKVGTIEDESMIDFAGTILADDPKNPLDSDIVVEIIEKDIPTEILERTDEIMRIKFDGEKVKGTIVIDLLLGNAHWEEGGPPPESREAMHKKRKKRGREYTSVSEILESGVHEDAVQVVSDLEDFLKSVAEAVYRVTHDDKEKYFNTRKEANDYASTYADAKIERLPELPEGKMLEAELKEVFRVSYAGKVKYFRRGFQARAYAKKNPGARVTKIDALPAGKKFTESARDKELMGLQEKLIKIHEQAPVKLTNERANLRSANPQNDGERCKSCIFFSEPDGCKIIEGPVGADLVCDWIQSRGVEDAFQYKVSDSDWLAFGLGMIEEQPYQHIVKDAALTPEGPMVLIADTSKPPHLFSLTKEFHISHTSLEHHWTQAEVDRLISIGKNMLESKHMAPEGKVYRVLWADGRGVQYFDNLEAAEEFSKQKGRDGGKPTLIDKPAGAKVKSKAPAIEESNETLLESEKESIPDPEATGRHAHPHTSDGVHQHEGLGEGGGHEHNIETFGGHRHDGESQLDGQHLNVGDGPHNHLIELGLTDYIEWSAKVHMTHPWIPDYTGARIRHLKPTPEAEAREATLEDWKEHTIWWMHSTGLANAVAHNAMFLDKETAIIEKTYMLKDGTERAPTEEDYQAEVLWFKQNTPPDLARKLLEARVIESINLELDDENKKVVASIPAMTLGQSEG